MTAFRVEQVSSPLTVIEKILALRCNLFAIVKFLSPSNHIIGQKFVNTLSEG